MTIQSGEFCVFVGPSGCGKSTLLRMIAGLEPITGGAVAIDGDVVNHISAANRGLAMVFQSYALYPHMSVRNNLSFGLENLRKNSVGSTIKNELENEADFKKRLNILLSGGELSQVKWSEALR